MSIEFKLVSVYESNEKLVKIRLDRIDGLYSYLYLTSSPLAQEDEAILLAQAYVASVFDILKKDLTVLIIDDLFVKDFEQSIKNIINKKTLSDKVEFISRRGLPQKIIDTSFVRDALDWFAIRFATKAKKKKLELLALTALENIQGKTVSTIRNLVDLPDQLWSAYGPTKFKNSFVKIIDNKKYTISQINYSNGTSSFQKKLLEISKNDSIINYDQSDGPCDVGVNHFSDCIDYLNLSLADRHFVFMFFLNHRADDCSYTDKILNIFRKDTYKHHNKNLNSDEYFDYLQELIHLEKIGYSLRKKLINNQSRYLTLEECAKKLGWEYSTEYLFEEISYIKNET